MQLLNSDIHHESLFPAGMLICGMIKAVKAQFTKHTSCWTEVWTDPALRTNLWTHYFHSNQPVKFDTLSIQLFLFIFLFILFDLGGKNTALWCVCGL